MGLLFSFAYIYWLGLWLTAGLEVMGCVAFVCDASLHTTEVICFIHGWSLLGVYGEIYSDFANCSDVLVMHKDPSMIHPHVAHSPVIRGACE
jgi:hypothetical protein